jgi:hypothetical protein
MGPAPTAVLLIGWKPAASSPGMSWPWGARYGAPPDGAQQFYKPKGVVMAKKNSSVPGQLDLIEVGPENLEKMTPHLRKYKAAVKERMAALKIEVEQKQIIMDLVQQAKLQPLPNGQVWRLTSNHATWSYTSRKSRRKRDEAARRRSQKPRAASPNPTRASQRPNRRSERNEPPSRCRKPSLQRRAKNDGL